MRAALAWSFGVLAVAVALFWGSVFHSIRRVHRARRYFTSPSTEAARGGIVPSDHGWRRGWAEPEGPETYIPLSGPRRSLGGWFGEG